MPEQFVLIRSIRSHGYLQFSEPKPPGIQYPVSSMRVDLKDRGSIVHTTVYLYDPTPLADFWAEIAADSQGWTGEKQWTSIENHLSFCCTFAEDTIALHVTLQSDPIPDGWRVESFIHVKAKDMEAIALQIRQFLHLWEQCSNSI